MLEISLPKTANHIKFLVPPPIYNAPFHSGNHSIFKIIVSAKFLVSIISGMTYAIEMQHLIITHDIMRPLCSFPIVLPFKECFFKSFHVFYINLEATDFKSYKYNVVRLMPLDYRSTLES